LVIISYQDSLLFPSSRLKKPKNGICVNSSDVFLSTPGLLDLSCGAGNFGKICLHAGKVKFKTKVEE
jgi:hypothetical protein